MGGIDNWYGSFLAFRHRSTAALLQELSLCMGLHSPSFCINERDRFVPDTPLLQGKKACASVPTILTILKPYLQNASRDVLFLLPLPVSGVPLDLLSDGAERCACSAFISSVPLLTSARD